MILVLLGTQNNSFDRLLNEIEKCIDNNKITDRVVVQSGYTNYTSDKMEIFDFISTSELNKLLLDADLIITHGGVGSIINAIKLGKKVIAIPRLAKFGEHVNDHQLQIIRSFNEFGYIKGITQMSDLADAIDNIKEFTPKQYKSNTQNILDIISNYIDNN